MHPSCTDHTDSCCRREVSPHQALLRLNLLAHHMPSACGFNPAAHLNNYALHAVTQRMSKLADPRMRALSSVAALQSLFVGSRANYPGYERMPVRRQRGDVHGDMTAIVVRLAWEGVHCSPPLANKAISLSFKWLSESSRPSHVLAAHYSLAGGRASSPGL